MNISSTRLSTSSTPSTQAQAPQFHPPVDWWELEGERYEDTASLLEALQDTESGRYEASYHFVVKEAEASEAVSSLTGAMKGAVDGALLTGAVALSGGLAMNLLMGTGYLLSAGMGGQPSYLNLASGGMALALGAGATVGAALGFYRSDEGSTEPVHAESISGTILTQEPNLGLGPTFFVDNDLKRDVDLQSYSVAKPLPALPELDEEASRRRHAEEAALAGASSGVPLFGYLNPMHKFGTMGSQLDGLRGAALGSLAGVAASALPWLGAHAAGAAGYAAGTATAAFAGGVAGYMLGPALERAAQVPPELEAQWWSKTS